MDQQQKLQQLKLQKLKQLKLQQMQAKQGQPLDSKIIRYVFHPAIYAAIQRSAQKDPRYQQYKNKPQGTAFNMRVGLKDVAKIDQQIKMSTQIQIPTSFSLTVNDRRLDRDFFILLLERIVTVKNFKELQNPEFYPMINSVIVELIENAEKAILEAIAPDAGIGKLTKKHFMDVKLRAQLVKAAISKKKEAIVVFEYSAGKLTIYVTNNIFISYAGIKNLEEKSSIGLTGANTLAQQFKKDDARIGAGLGLTMAKTILDGIAEKAHIEYTFGPDRDKNSHTVMKIEFICSKPPSTMAT
jgi:hypothetical protein